MEVHLKRLTCKSCGAPLGAEAISERLAVVRCNHCGCVFALETAPAAEHVDPPRREVPLPKNMEMFDSGNGLVIRRKWPVAQGLALSGFCVVWLAVCTTIFSGFRETAGGGIFSLFALIFFGAGAVMGYTGLAMVLNTSTVRVEGQSVTIRHGPLPLRFGAELACPEIEQVYCCRKLTHHENSTRESFQVIALMRSGASRKLLADLDQAEQAIFVEQQIETFLGIRDRRVGDPDEVAY